MLSKSPDYSDTTVKIKWESEVPNGRYLYFDGRRWVPCNRDKVRAFLSAGMAVHMNPAS